MIHNVTQLQHNKKGIFFT